MLLYLRLTYTAWRISVTDKLIARAIIDFAIFLTDAFGAGFAGRMELFAIRVQHVVHHYSVIFMLSDFNVVVFLIIII